MAVLTVAALRARIAAGVEAVTNWDESALPAEMFIGQSDRRAHLGFAVAVPITTIYGGQRQKAAEGALVTSEVRVHWMYRLRGDNAVAAYDEALAQEVLAIAAVLTVARTDLTALVYRSTERAALPEGWLVSTLVFEAVHRIALS